MANRDSVERIAEGVILAVFALFRLARAIFHIVWLVTVALYRAVDDLRSAENSGAFICIYAPSS
jgi:hypothetical protein